MITILLLTLLFALAGAIGALVRVDLGLGRALRFEIPPWS